MTDAPTPLRTDETPCLLFPELLERGGGLQKAVQERASLYARQWQEVRLLTTGFSRDWYRVPVALKERGSLHRRVRVRNFFAHSDWVSRLGVPPGAGQPAERPVAGARHDVPAFLQSMYAAVERLPQAPLPAPASMRWSPGRTRRRCRM